MPAKIEPDSVRPSAIYLSASIFDWADRAFNRKLQEIMTAAGHQVILIQESDREAGEEELFNRRFQGLKQSGLVLALVTGPDLAPCVAFDLGLAKAWGIPAIVLKTDFNQRGLVNHQAVDFVIKHGSGSIVTSGADFFNDAVQAANRFFQAD